MTKLNQKGQLLIPVVVAVAVVLFTVLFIIGGSQVYYQNSQYSYQAESASALAEAGADKAIASINKTAGSYSGEAETILGSGSFSVTVTSPDANTRIVESTGYVPSKAAPKSSRKIAITLSKGAGASFNYGVQVGEGGLEMGNSNAITGSGGALGSMYSNGNIVAGNSNTITGDVWVAGGVQPVADQQTDCTGINCADFLFGRNISGEDRLDVAQSFIPATTAVLNKVSFKLKKIGNPSNVTVRIMRDSSGKPDKNNVLTSGTLSSSLVTTSYGFVDVTFSSSITLNSGVTYWMMVDTSSNSSNYWGWQADLAQSYSGGVAKWSPNWNAGSPVWNNPSPQADLSFKVWMGGSITSINGGNSFNIGGSAHANTIISATIAGNAYYASAGSVSSVTAGGQNCVTNPNPPKCNPNSTDPPPQAMPISDGNIAEWKTQAQNAGIISAPDCNPATPWGPGKVNGNITINNSCTETIKTPIWITGDFSLNNSNIFTLDASYGSSSGMIIVDGISSMNNSNHLNGTGVGSSVVMLLSNYDSRSNSINAVNVNNAGNTGVMYAPYGIVEVNNSNNFKELTAWKIKLNNSVTVTYDSGLAALFFSSGPSGSFNIVKGTYQVK